MSATAWAWLALVAFAAGIFAWLAVVLMFAAGARLGEALLKAWKDHRL